MCLGIFLETPAVERSKGAFGTAASQSQAKEKRSRKPLRRYSMRGFRSIASAWRKFTVLTPSVDRPQTQMIDLGASGMADDTAP